MAKAVSKVKKAEPEKEKKIDVVESKSDVPHLNLAIKPPNT